MHRIRCFLLLLVIVPCQPLFGGTRGATVVIQGQVLRPAREPVAHATIRIGNEVLARTDRHGRFVCSVPSLPVVLIIHPGSGKPFPYRIEYPSDRIITIQVPLQQTLTEQVSVVASTRPEAPSDLPFAATVLPAVEIESRLADSIASLVATTPGVDWIGSGGFSVTPTIRGIGRRRIKLLTGDLPIVSDRRAGTSAAFIPPEFLASVDIVRTGAAVFTGSDAIGGAIRLNLLSETTEPAGTAFSSTIGTAGPATRFSITSTGRPFGRQHLSIGAGLFMASAGDYRAPDEVVHHSGYDTRAALLTGSRDTGRSRTSVTVLLTDGHDIGKPDRVNDPSRWTENPYRFDHLAMLSSEYTGFRNTLLRVSAGIHAFRYQVLKTDEQEDSARLADTTGLNGAWRVSLRGNNTEDRTWQIGADGFFRNRISTDNVTRIGHDVTRTHPLDGSNRDDLAVFASIRQTTWFGGHLDIGGRWSRSRVTPGTDRPDPVHIGQSFSWFTGWEQSIRPGLKLLVHAGSSFRVPSLSELYYSGITGRKLVIGNPELRNETGRELAVGLRHAGVSTSLELYAFRHRIGSMIERYRNPDNIYTFANVESGRIQGIEVLGAWQPLPDIELNGSYIRVRGRTSKGDPLNDIPMARLQMGITAYFGRLQTRLHGIYRWDKRDPGPGEEPVSGSLTWQCQVHWIVSRSHRWYCQIRNLTDQPYRVNADPDLPDMPGLSLQTGIRLMF